MGSRVSLPGTLTVVVTTMTLTLLPAPALAATLMPTTPSDVTANDGLCSLREAITASFQKAPSGPATGECPAGEGGDTIALAGIRYVLAGAPGDNANASGDLDIRNSLTIVGLGASQTVIDANQVDRVIEVRPFASPVPPVTIAGVTITGGQTQNGTTPPPTIGAGGDAQGQPGGAGGSGGGILSSSDLIVRDSAVVGNRTGDGGNGGSATGANGATSGAAGFAGSGGVGGFGGSGGGISSDAPLIVERSTISNNVTGKGGNGGPGFGGNGVTGTGSGVGGTGGFGDGGVGAFGGSGAGISALGRVTLLDSRLTGNTAGAGGNGGLGAGGLGAPGGSGGGPGGTGGHGRGGIGGGGGSGAGIRTEVPADIQRTLIDHNTSGAGGAGGLGSGGSAGAGQAGAKGGTGGLGEGGIGGFAGIGAGLLADASATLSNTTVTANGGGQGGQGGQGNGGSGGGPVPANPGPGGAGTGKQGGLGGDVAGVFAGFGTTALLHATVTGNTFGAGGAGGTALPGLGTPNGQVTTGAVGAPGDTGGLDGLVTLTNSIVASNAGKNCDATPADGGHNIVFGDTTCPGASVDPKLGPLQDNGGPVPTQAIAGDSPARDAVPASGAGCAPTDQRGVARPQGPACDSGAFELVPPGPETPGPGTQDLVAPRFRFALMSPTLFAVNRSGRRETPVTSRARRGTRFRYGLTENARVLFTVQRARPGRRVRGRCRKPSPTNRTARRCTRFVRVGRFAVMSSAGTNRHRFSGRIGRRSLKPGKHRVVLVATDAAGNSSGPLRLRFRVVR